MTTASEPAPTTTAPATTSRAPRLRAMSRVTPIGDLGLLVLRLTLAVSFIGHGAQKFGYFGGTGIQGFANGTLAGYGFRFPVALAYVNGATELAGGVLMVLGLLTPLAATGLMAVMIDSTLLKFGNGFFFTNPGGFEIDLVLGGLAAGVVLLGSGRIGLDAALPAIGRAGVRVTMLVIGVVAALAVYFFLR